MINYSCLIINDSETDVRVLQNQLNKLLMLKPIDVCSSVDEILPHLIQRPYDLLFLDMNLPGQSGINWLRTSTHRPPTIVTTSSPDFAVDCYELDVADYLVKPISADRLFRAINRGLVGRTPQQIGSDTRTIFLPVNNSLQKFSFEDINYFESHGTYTKVHTRTDILLVNESISSLQERLPSRRFMRIQKSIIVNLTKLTAIEPCFVWLNDAKLPTGKAYRDSLKHLVQGNTQKLDNPDEAAE